MREASDFLSQLCFALTDIKICSFSEHTPTRGRMERRIGQEWESEGSGGSKEKTKWKLGDVSEQKNLFILHILHMLRKYCNDSNSANDIYSSNISSMFLLFLVNESIHSKT